MPNLSHVMVAALLAVAGPASAESPETTEDLRCLVAVAAAAGASDQMTATMVAPGFMYFMGRIEGREGEFDLETALRREAATTTAGRIQADALRCGKIMVEKGQALQAIGKSMQSMPEVKPDT